VISEQLQDRAATGSELAMLNLFDSSTGAPLDFSTSPLAHADATARVTALGGKYLARKSSRVLVHIGASR